MVSALLFSGVLDPASEGRTETLCLLEKLLTQVLCECDERISSTGQVDSMLIPWAGMFFFVCTRKYIRIDFSNTLLFKRPPFSFEIFML
jgi:hypothetical protein